MVMNLASFCIRCGTPRTADGLYCPKCGAKLPSMDLAAEAAPESASASSRVEPVELRQSELPTAGGSRVPSRAPDPSPAGTVAGTVSTSSPSSGKQASQSQGEHQALLERLFPSGADPVPPAPVPRPSPIISPSRRSSTLDGIIDLGPGPWALIWGVGMAVGTVLPWLQTNGLVSLSFNALSEFSQDLGLALVVGGTAVAIGAAAVMIVNPESANNETLPRTYAGALIAAIIGVGLVLFEFMSASQSAGGLYSSFFGPGIGILVTGASAVLGLIAIRPGASS